MALDTYIQDLLNKLTDYLVDAQDEKVALEIQLQTEKESYEEQLLVKNNEITTLKARIAELEGTTPEEPEEPVPPTTYKGIWLSKEEILARPNSGSAWDRIMSQANSSWGTANLGDNNAQHDQKVLAGAIVAVRNNDNAMREKTIVGLKSAMVSRLTRTLELSRGLQAYVVAADIIGYQDSAFKAWVEKMVLYEFPKDDTHSGQRTILVTARNLWNNWSMHARSSVLAAGLYLGKQEWVDTVLEAHKRLIGMPSKLTDPVIWAKNEWAAGTPLAGVNVKGAKIGNVNVSGVLHQDWLRGSYDFRWLPVISGYMWEGIQGFVSTAVMLHRAGLLSFNAGDDAVVRAFNMLYGVGEAASNSPKFVNPAEGDDIWTVWVVNKYGNQKYPTSPDVSPGKGMGYGEWAFA
jgi:hypothetical protein